MEEEDRYCGKPTHCVSVEHLMSLYPFLFGSVADQVDHSEKPPVGADKPDFLGAGWTW